MSTYRVEGVVIVLRPEVNVRLVAAVEACSPQEAEAIALRAFQVVTRRCVEIMPTSVSVQEVTG